MPHREGLWGLLRADKHSRFTSPTADKVAVADVQFHLHEGPRQMLLSTAPDQLVVESSPNDFYWGRGIDGTGSNLLGKLLMRVRSELLQAEKLLSSVTTNGAAAQPQRLQQESDAITF